MSLVHLISRHYFSQTASHDFRSCAFENQSCFGRFIMEKTTDNGKSLTTYVWVISHKQTSSSRLSCRVAPIDSIPKCPLRPKSATMIPMKGSEAKPVVSAKMPSTATQSSTSKPKKKGFGLLGNLVGAQRRTNHQVVTSNAPPVNTQRVASESSSDKNVADQSNESSSDKNVADQSSETAETTTGTSEESLPLLTSNQILTDFRNEMEQKMLDFDIAPDVSLKVHVKLSDQTKRVQESDKGKITMEVLKYIVYEQAEEVNDEWIAQKEPGEFTDEITVAIYKDADSAPAEVLEQINQAEIPAEMRAQQILAAQKQRKQEADALRIQEILQRQALRKMAAGGGGQEGEGTAELSVLNTEKRDLRTIEEIQKESAKRQKIE